MWYLNFSFDATAPTTQIQSIIGSRTSLVRESNPWLVVRVLTLAGSLACARIASGAIADRRERGLLTDAG